MKYNFDEIIPRRGTNSYKWDTPEADVLPMWVADMDFRTAPAIIEDLQKRVCHGIFGYTKVPQEYYDAVADWFETRHGWTIDNRWIIYTSGVVPAISAIIKALSHPGDEVIVQTPVYNCFYSSIRNNGCKMVANKLLHERGIYTIDFDDLEQKAAHPEAKILLLCNPHNPVGRVWTREELTRIGDICLRHNVFVIADEIHCELTYEGHEYIPFGSISEEVRLHSATCISPSKAFNIAGLQIANIVAENDEIRKKIDRAINDNEVCDVNPFGVIATISAYNKGREWLDDLLKYLRGNYQYIYNLFHEQLPQYPISPLEGTYLAWIDCRETGMSSDELAKELLEKQRLMVNAGSMYGPGGEGFIRLNLACPRKVLEDGTARLADFLLHR